MMRNISELKIKYFQKGVSDYYQTNGRKSVPWRKTKDPWRVLIAEILLRKTTAGQVEPIYKILCKKSPVGLTKISNKELQKVLLPLGIHKERARLLKIIAEEVNKIGKKSLRNEDFLKSLPGVGPYATNTVLCFAFGEPKPALDRNMIRILERVFLIKSDRPRPHTDPWLWEISGEIVPLDNPKHYNWGVLDLASELCRPKNPKCSECPLLKICHFGEKIKKIKQKNYNLSN